MVAPTIGVIALQGGVREHADMLTDLGAQVRLVRRPADVDKLDGVVIPGGESSTIDRLLRTFGCTDALSEALAGGLPVLGTCAGLIMLATEIVDPAPGQQSLGVIDMVVRRNAFGPQINSAVETIETSFGPATGAFIRAPKVESVGEGTRVVAKRGDAIVGVETDTALAVSFHPELTGDQTVHRHFLGKIGE
ncbi:pyridoxal 5'-phosphate synthase glutaminase subunit PdxT [Corynebacterium sp.]|uniref:pyridoxal 5'-phosphate synthase glutaminase subunit PdxT n=1 Tax=Corynebacterium sp. TaxID=1720 RepID=UPI002A90EE44|nr:pyridoxal 5'-phosphate synthase glutaminase subunit PdxT [Corynebacterium sp.]MDY5785730.1 pyridoxal 5'-phosphate synthase glutaminase subunit PdxT [Corynebacterium sp.]